MWTPTARCPFSKRVTDRASSRSRAVGGSMVNTQVPRRSRRDAATSSSGMAQGVSGRHSSAWRGWPVRRRAIKARPITRGWGPKGAAARRRARGPSPLRGHPLRCRTAPVPSPPLSFPPGPASQSTQGGNSCRSPGHTSGGKVSSWTTASAAREAASCTVRSSLGPSTPEICGGASARGSGSARSGVAYASHPWASQSPAGRAPSRRGGVPDPPTHLDAGAGQARVPAHHVPNHHQSRGAASSHGIQPQFLQQDSGGVGPRQAGASRWHLASATAGP